MRQRTETGKLEFAVGYVLKRTAVALRVAMDNVLGPLGLTVAQYACLELLDQNPGQSNAELARGAFVSRQSMNQVLRGLQNRGLVTRPAQAPRGRALPTRLTEGGRLVLQTAATEVDAIEGRMVSELSPVSEERLLRDLLTCTRSLTAETPVAEA